MQSKMVPGFTEKWKKRILAFATIVAAVEAPWPSSQPESAHNLRHWSDNPVKLSHSRMTNVSQNAVGSTYRKAYEIIVGSVRDTSSKILSTARTICAAFMAISKMLSLCKVLN